MLQTQQLKMTMTEDGSVLSQDKLRHSSLRFLITKVGWGAFQQAEYHLKPFTRDVLEVITKGFREFHDVNGCKNTGIIPSFGPEPK